MSPVVTPPSDPGYYPNPLTAPQRILVASAVIRLDTTGLAFVIDADHACVGVQSVEIDTSGQIAVRHTRVGRVCNAAADPDETLGGEKGVTTGVSGGGVLSLIWLHHPSIPTRRLVLTRPDEYALVASSRSNVWFRVWQMQETPT